MITSVAITCALVLSSGYLAVFHPKVFSGNVTPLKTLKCKIILYTGFSVVGIGLMLCNPHSEYGEWVQYLFVLTFILIGCIDGYSKIIPNKLVLILFLIAVLRFIIQPDLGLLFSLGSVIGAGVVVVVILSRSYSKKYIGWGDIKLLAAIALFTGWDYLVILYIGIVLAGLFGIAGLMGGKLHKKTQVPLAPFLFCSYMITTIYNIDIELITRVLQN